MGTTNFKAYCSRCDKVTHQTRIVQKNSNGETIVDITTCGECGNDI